MGNTKVITTKRFGGASPQKLVLTGFNNHPRIPIIEAVLETFHTDWNMPVTKGEICSVSLKPKRAKDVGATYH